MQCPKKHRHCGLDPQSHNYRTEIDYDNVTTHSIPKLVGVEEIKNLEVIGEIETQAIIKLGEFIANAEIKYV